MGCSNYRFHDPQSREHHSAVFPWYRSYETPLRDMRGLWPICVPLKKILGPTWKIPRLSPNSLQNETSQEEPGGKSYERLREVSAVCSGMRDHGGLGS